MTEATHRPDTSAVEPTPDATSTVPEQARQRPTEIGGPAGPEPTRYGDWERKGRCVDF
ncbi:DUF1674 domain-containing protein [Ameyamaea chiangmaiensis]|uniref:DUF1674 domain-containing protein n=1 Tax=Ameyamaea chiangmaiensis TaxID=442969 RepID=A0A850PG63_9PROT|nr:DUF1674 domain-containing protein [Ameyamaea chiangmaiensis]MBS4075610.1 DUF1674 domain-containing protein [Ameyamaea chiangmaiensis]NVN40151.1 DUF1674 domain-containing protein [Ameyamaea chiangmaiensis]